jgi:hypothetical protein
MKKLIIISLGFLCLSLSAKAQDAGNFSQTALDLMMINPGGSARIQGMGGVGTALGGDISSAFINPAGLGFYNRSEVSLSPSLNFLSSDGRYLNSVASDAKTNFNFANLGVVINKTSPGREGYKGGNIGISVNRIASFQNSMAYEGINPNRDFVDYAVDAENAFDGLVPDDLSLLALNVGVIAEFSVPDEGQQSIFINGIETPVSLLDKQNGEYVFFDRNTYRGDDLGFPTEANPTTQFESIETRGATYQTSISYGGNYNDKIFFGASLGLLFTRQEVDRLYVERPSNTDLRELTLSDEYIIDGGGINGTFGVIVRPVTPLLLGVSYTTPTLFILEQTRELVLSTTYNDGEFFADGFLYPSFQYDLKTPSRFRAGATFFFGKSGFITGDVETINYGNADLRSPTEGNFSFDNQTISQFNSAINYRFGAEYRLDIFRFRAGYSHFDDPTDNGVDNADDQFTFGTGIKTERYFVDLGVVTGIDQRTNVTPFPTAPTADITTQSTRAVLTVGFTF